MTFVRFLPTTFLAAACLSACAVHTIPASGPEIAAMLADHTALLPGGFAEYYAPDGKLHGMSDGQPYEGTWEIRGDTFCTALDGDPAVCSQVVVTVIRSIGASTGKRRSVR